MFANVYQGRLEKKLILKSCSMIIFKSLNLAWPDNVSVNI